MNLVEHVKKKITAWAQCKLTESAKIILINFILLGMVAHVIKTSKLSMSISKKLDSLFTRFWWSKSGEKGIHWINRQRVQLPKGMGGLGIRSASIYNGALLFKHILKMHMNPQFLAARIYNVKSDYILCPTVTYGSPLQPLFHGSERLSILYQLK